MEYRFRKLFPISHDEFMCENAETVDWMLAIDGVVNQMESEVRDG